MATRINPDRMRLFKEFTTLFLGELLRYPVVRDLDVVGIAFVGKDGVTLRVDRNLPHGGDAFFWGVFIFWGVKGQSREPGLWFGGGFGWLVGGCLVVLGFFWLGGVGFGGCIGFWG